jgi:hypothetical protein
MNENKVSDLNTDLNELKVLCECPICYEDMQESRILPCFHKFCSKCIEQLEQEKVVDGKISCPICRKEHIVKQNNISDLNLAQKSSIISSNTISESACNNCCCSKRVNS